MYCAAFKDHGDIFRLRGLAQEIIVDPANKDLKVKLAQFDVTLYKKLNDTRLADGHHIRGFVQGSISLPLSSENVASAPALAPSPDGSSRQSVEESVDEQAAANTTPDVDEDDDDEAKEEYVTTSKVGAGGTVTPRGSKGSQPPDEVFFIHLFSNIVTRGKKTKKNGRRTNSVCIL